MNDALQAAVVAQAEADARADWAKERRNQAINLHNNALAVVGHDKQLAYRSLCSAIIADPTMASAWYFLGNACADLKMLDASIAAFRRCLDCPPGDRELAGDLTPKLRIQARVNLAHRLHQAGQNDEAFHLNREVLAELHDRDDLDPESGGFAWTNMGMIASVRGDMDEAVRLCREAFRRDQRPIIQTGLALALMMAGKYAEGMSHFEARFAYKPELRSYIEYPYQRWGGGDAPDKTLFVASEQGIGDTLSFTRFVVMAAAKVERLIFAVQPELRRLMQDALRHVANVEIVPLTNMFPVADLWVPVGSLPVALGLTDAEIAATPQGWSLSPDVLSGMEMRWRNPDAKLHVGIAWYGSPGNEINQWRSIPFHHFLELYRIPGVQLYSLQVGEAMNDLHAAGAAGLVRDLSAYIRDTADTAALMQGLDLVVTCESFLGHLAGALGMECWLPVSRNGGDWRLGRHGNKALWYGNHRLFRQGKDATWQPVFERIVQAMKERANA